MSPTSRSSPGCGRRCTTPARRRPGHEAVVVSHQLPIWITRLEAEGRPFLHDPRKRHCTLCSLTSFTFDDERLVSVGYSEPAGDLIPLADRGAPFSAGGADEEHRPPSGPIEPPADPTPGQPLGLWPEVRAPLRLLLAVLLVGCGHHRVRWQSTGTGDKGYVAGKGIITRLAEADRKKPGEVSGTTLDGKEVSLDEYAGKVVVLNVWGSWCAPCRKEAPPPRRGRARARGRRRGVRRGEHQGLEP